MLVFGERAGVMAVTIDGEADAYATVHHLGDDRGSVAVYQTSDQMLSTATNLSR